MSVPAVTITRDGPETVPFAYMLGAKESFEPDAIAATFDGTGAAGSFLACCSFYSQDGSLIARCPAATAVAAGDTATISYFPLAPSAAAAAPAGGFAYSRGWTDVPGHGDPNISVPAHGNIRAPFAHVDADPTGAITWTATVNPNDTAVLHSPGIYLVLSTVQFDSYAFGIAAFGYDLSGDQIPHMSWGGQGILDTGALTSGIGLPTNEDFTVIRVQPASTENLSLLLQQNTAFALNVHLAYMTISYLGAA